MAWTKDIDKQMIANLDTQKNLFETNLKSVRDGVASVALNLPGAYDRDIKARIQVHRAIQNVERMTESIVDKINKITTASRSADETIEDKRKEVLELKKELKGLKTLGNIREEQADALKQKYDANYHSSWLGLWRPLSEQTHLGLFVASVSFAIVTFCLIGYFVYQAFFGYKSSPGLANLVQQVGEFKPFKAIKEQFTNPFAKAPENGMGTKMPSLFQGVGVGGFSKKLFLRK